MMCRFQIWSKEAGTNVSADKKNENQTQKHQEFDAGAYPAKVNFFGGFEKSYDANGEYQIKKHEQWKAEIIVIDQRWIQPQSGTQNQDS